MKFLTLAALVGLLAACNAGATTPSAQTLPTQTASTAAVASPPASTATTSCADAFASVDLGAIKSSGDLTSLSDELDSTISACSSVNEWTTALQTAVPNVSIIGALDMLQARCAASPDLAKTSLCTQVHL
jgi:hypothetical protein